MSLDRQALDSYIHNSIRQERALIGEQGIAEMLDRGKRWDLSATLREGGTIIFPHAGLKDCGPHIAAAVHACLDSGAKRVLAVGVLHALTEELQDARMRVANGGDVTQEKYWGIQGPGLIGRREWENEFSLLNFLYLWEKEVERRRIDPPELIVRYPYLAGGKPEILPGIEELQEIVKDAVVVTTTDAFHHGIGYRESRSPVLDDREPSSRTNEDPPEQALYPEQGGLDLARRRIDEGLEILGRGDYWGYNQHCVSAKSDGRDVGQVVRYLLGPLAGRILDLTYTDTTEMYNAPPPTWVAAALIEMKQVAS